MCVQQLSSCMEALAGSRCFFSPEGLIDLCHIVRQGSVDAAQLTVLGLPSQCVPPHYPMYYYCIQIRPVSSPEACRSWEIGSSKSVSDLGRRAEAVGIQADVRACLAVGTPDLVGCPLIQRIDGAPDIRPMEQRNMPSGVQTQATCTLHYGTRSVKCFHARNHGCTLCVARRYLSVPRR